jgi:hypothetical protein
MDMSKVQREHLGFVKGNLFSVRESRRSGSGRRGLSEGKALQAGPKISGLRFLLEFQNFNSLRKSDSLKKRWNGYAVSPRRKLKRKRKSRIRRRMISMRTNGT